MLPWARRNPSILLDRIRSLVSFSRSVGRLAAGAGLVCEQTPSESVQAQRTGPSRLGQRCFFWREAF